MKEGICQPSFNGCFVDPRYYPERLPAGVILDNDDPVVPQEEEGNGEENIETDEFLELLLQKKHAGFVEVCDTYNVQEVICQGVVSITYYACPSAGVVIGSSLGYITLVEMAAIPVIISLYLLFRFVVTGECYSFSDLMETPPPPQPPSKPETTTTTTTTMTTTTNR